MDHIMDNQVGGGGWRNFSKKKKQKKQVSKNYASGNISQPLKSPSYDEIIFFTAFFNEIIVIYRFTFKEVAKLKEMEKTV